MAKCVHYIAVPLMIIVNALEDKYKKTLVPRREE